jgi:adenosyl cobinamide kinase/adenosyl cobinamide phosphate guanylyltransferase
MTCLVLGGTRSGKSAVAEKLAARDGRSVTYVATGQASDADMAARIAIHQARRDPAVWSTVEATGPELADTLAAQPGPVLLDSLGTWVASFADLAPDADRLLGALADRQDRGLDTVVVSEEVGLGIHAPTAAGRQFADILGEHNRRIADQADQVLLVVAGRVLPLLRAEDSVP